MREERFLITLLVGCLLAPAPVAAGETGVGQRPHAASAAMPRVERSQSCRVRFAMNSWGYLVDEIQVRLHYDLSDGTFDGAGHEVACRDEERFASSTFEHVVEDQQGFVEATFSGRHFHESTSTSCTTSTTSLSTTTTVDAELHGPPHPPRGNGCGVRRYPLGNCDFVTPSDAPADAGMFDAEVVYARDFEGKEQQPLVHITSVHCTWTPACGDANNDGTFSASDSLLILRVAVGARACTPQICDVRTGNGITAADALHVLLVAVGTLDAATFACPVPSAPSVSASASTPVRTAR